MVVIWLFYCLALVVKVLGRGYGAVWIVSEAAGVRLPWQTLVRGSTVGVGREVGWRGGGVKKSREKESFGDKQASEGWDWKEEG